MTLKKIILVLSLPVIFILGFIILKYPQRVEQKITNTSIIVEDAINTIAPKPTKILENGLPDRYLLETAFIEQAPEKNWEQPWQDACEEAGLLTVDYFYKKVSPSPLDIKQSILDMIDFETSQGWKKDINIEQISRISSEYLGYNPTIISNPTLEEIKKYLSQNIPVIVPSAGKILYKENKHFKNNGPEYHTVVILGYDDNKKQFTVHDVGTQFGKYFRYSYDLLLESNHDLPKSGDKSEINSGDKKMLILTKSDKISP